MEKKTYETLKQCAASENIPLQWLSIAKNILGAPGFRGSRVDWHELKPWLDDHADEIELAVNQDTEELKRQKLAKEIILKELEIAERKKEILYPDDVFEFLGAIGKAQDAVLNSKEKELAAKVDAGTAKLVSKVFGEIRTIYAKELGTWMQNYKKSS